MSTTRRTIQEVTDDVARKVGSAPGGRLLVEHVTVSSFGSESTNGDLRCDGTHRIREVPYVHPELEYPEWVEVDDTDWDALTSR